MKMRKQKVVAEVVDVGQGLESVIHEHASFFDKLVELIPAKFYLPTDDEKPWFQGLNKKQKEKAKKKTIQNIKKSKVQRLDPEKPVTTLELLKKSLGKEKANEGEEEEDVVKPFVSGLDGDDRSVTYEELRQRLHRKLEGFRSTRNCADPEKAAKKREDRDTKRGYHYQDNKRKRDDATDESKPEPDEKLQEKVKKDATEASKQLVFGHVKLQDEEMLGKKRKISKHKELERAKKLEELKKNDPEKGEAIAKKEAWKAAMDRASGIKVHDDPKLIKKSIHKVKKQQEKNAEKWEERVQSRDQLKAEKQKKRSDNIAERINDKKMRKIAKREKKLLRPGFEGRKEGFINSSSG